MGLRRRSDVEGEDGRNWGRRQEGEEEAVVWEMR
jgi:hypothetical protein